MAFAKITGIYIIKNTIDESSYVGSSKNIKQRIATHHFMLRNGVHANGKLQSFFTANGMQCFYYEILEVCSESVLIEREQHYLNTLKPAFNISPTAGSLVGIQHSEETKLKMSLKRKGVLKSEETKRRLSISQLGNTKGKNMSIEYREKRRQQMIERNKDPEFTAKRIAALKKRAA